MSYLPSMVLKKLINISGQKILIPFYHAVSNNELDFTNGLYPPRKIRDFERDIDILLKYLL